MTAWRPICRAEPGRAVPMPEFSALPAFRPGPPRPQAARRPLSMRPAPDTERHVVPGGGALLVELRPGDRLRLVDAEGAQPAVILAAHADGRADAGLLGVHTDRDPSPLPAMLAGGDSGMTRLAAGLARRGIDPAAPVIGLFGAGSRPGDSAEFTAQGRGWAVIAAPGGPMDAARQDTATPVTVTLTRAAPRATGLFALPDPLADPILDLRVPSASARAYLVRKGEYLQVIDVDGRQCTDFQCFDARKADRGLFHPLDVTTTRTLQGRAYPVPGLHGKYFDQDMTALVEVVQDTCGRHDAFALACSAKYYDDIGYPGHANCSENFNAALAEFGIPGRPGWMAANFFFNTAIDAHGVMIADEPWSRPGDYVLMRALTDIICVSSACPDDTSPANGWAPTDIHLRSYAASEVFTRASAWRLAPEEDPIMTRPSAFHAPMQALGANMVEYRGFWLPGSFAGTSATEAYWACREAVVAMDLSALRKAEVTGPDAEALLDWILTRDVTRLGEGQVVYSAMCHPHGGMIDDGTLFRLGAQNFRWIGGSDEGPDWMRREAARLGLDVLVRGSTDQLHNLAVQGPQSRALLEGLIWTAPHQPRLADLGWFRFTPARLGGPEGIPLVVSRTGYTGELGYELFCHPRDAAALFDAVWAAGQAHGIRPMGLDGLDLVRIEAGLVFAGYDFSDQTDPFEAGIGFTVPLKTKAGDFVGRAALIRRKAHPARKFVGLEIDAPGPLAHGDCIRIGRAQLGEICSAMRSPRSGRSIALARIDISCAETGTEVEVGQLDGHMKRYPARIASFPHYDPGKTRPRG